MEQEEALARELQRMNLETMRDEKMRQQIRETRSAHALWLMVAVNVPVTVCLNVDRITRATQC